ncbi:MAG: hypothetical protein Q8T11_00860 [Elusimicrobiota bacterium]|nr:hypothetical protein [Elusimicrobiota bacterium]
MSIPPDDKDAAIARLLDALADLSGEEAALEACRLEAEAFDPAAAAESVKHALLALNAERKPP